MQLGLPLTNTSFLTFDSVSMNKILLQLTIIHLFQETKSNLNFSDLSRDTREHVLRKKPKHVHSSSVSVTRESALLSRSPEALVT